MNPVISREYVQKNYIKKSDLKDFVDSELKAIKECKQRVQWQEELKGMEAVYKAIKNIFLEETKDANK